MSDSITIANNEAEGIFNFNNEDILAKFEYLGTLVDLNDSESPGTVYQVGPISLKEVPSSLLDGYDRKRISKFQKFQKNEDMSFIIDIIFENDDGNPRRYVDVYQYEQQM